MLSLSTQNQALTYIPKIYVYPIKSLRGVKLNEAVGTKYGFKHDRKGTCVLHPPSLTYSVRNIYALGKNRRWV